MPPIPGRILMTNTASGVGRVKSLSFFKFLWKNAYIILFILFLLPNWVDSVHTAKEMNYSVPLYLGLKTGQTVLNSDSMSYEMIKGLEKDPVQAIGVAKPEIGIWNHLVYWWHIFIFAWKLFGYLFFIFLPFKVIYKIVRTKDKDKVRSNVWKTFVIGFIFIFVMNMLVIIIQQAMGNVIYTFDNSLNFFQKALLILTWVFPFHGVYELGRYIITSLFL